MFATFGLERLESAIGGRPADRDLDELLSRVPRPRPAPVPPPGPAVSLRLDHEPDLPTRLCQGLNGNPQFRPARQVNGV